MKRFGILAAGLCAAFVLTACNSTETQNTSAGAVGNKSACCANGEAKTCAAGEAKACAKGEAACCKAGAKADDKGSMGAVSGTKGECTKTCPATGQTKDAPMGAVGEKKSGCCSKSAS
jgi:hypothetical protein